MCAPAVREPQFVAVQLRGADLEDALQRGQGKSASPSVPNAALLSILEVAPVNRTTLERAAESAVGDYEDAVVIEAARQANATCIVARDEGDFARSALPVYSPVALIGLLAQLPKE